MSIDTTDRKDNDKSALSLQTYAYLGNDDEVKTAVRARDVFGALATSEPNENPLLAADRMKEAIRLSGLDADRVYPMY